MTEIRTLLVANRGEIARRVFRTCADLGIRTVAVFTDLDADALHVRDADVAVRVPSYLDAEAVLAAAQEAGADAIHPGYGFLSENAGFARAVAGAGITWIGPTAEVIDAMGRKDAARDIAVKAGVPVVPSYSLEDDPATFAYPVLAKAAAGGGGKGMRVVRSAEELPEAVAAAKREALSAFGDDAMIIEKYVERGRHIEVQVLGDGVDGNGTVHHFGTRECSAQRRHQKVIEEAPAPGLADELRERMHAAAVALGERRAEPHDRQPAEAARLLRATDMGGEPGAAAGGDLALDGVGVDGEQVAVEHRPDGPHLDRHGGVSGGARHRRGGARRLGGLGEVEVVAGVPRRRGRWRGCRRGGRRARRLRGGLVAVARSEDRKTAEERGRREGTTCEGAPRPGPVPEPERVTPVDPGTPR